MRRLAARLRALIARRRLAAEPTRHYEEAVVGCLWAPASGFFPCLRVWADTWRGRGGISRVKDRSRGNQVLVVKGPRR